MSKQNFLNKATLSMPYQKLLDIVANIKADDTWDNDSHTSSELQGVHYGLDSLVRRNRELYLPQKPTITKPKNTIVSWQVNIQWDNNEIENLDHIPDWVAKSMDTYLNEVEQVEWEDQKL